MSKLLTIIILVILTIALIFYSAFLFRIRKIEIEQNQACLENLSLDNLKLNNRLIFLLDKNQTVSYLKSQFPCISDVEIQKKLPSTLKIKLISKVAVVKIDQNNFYASAEGLIMESPNSAAKLPVFYPPQGLSLKLGAKISDGTILFALSITSELLQSDFSPTSVRIVGSGDVAVYNQVSTVALFSSKKDPKSQIDSLQKILAQAKIDASKITKIDLRFDKPVIEFK